MTDEAQKCQGCGDVSPMTMQCPLCQAEGSTLGFFCSQACFAKNWLAHRDEMHKKGATKEKKRSDQEERQKRLAAGELVGDVEDEGKKKKKVKKPEVVAPAPIFDGRWKALPLASQCSATKTGIIQPALNARNKLPPRLVVAVKHSDAASSAASAGPSGTSIYDAPAALQRSVSVDSADGTQCSATSLWSAAVAAAHLVAHAVNDNQIVIVAGSAVSAFAAAWALKSAACMASSQVELVLSTDKAQLAVEPEGRPNKAPVRIITVHVLASIASTGASLDAWLSNKLMVTLPDVRKPEDLQTMTTRAVFFVLESTAATDSSDVTATPQKGSAKKRGRPSAAALAEARESLTPTHHVNTLSVSQVPCPNTVFPISVGSLDKAISLEDVIDSKDEEAKDEEDKQEDEEEELTGAEAETAKIATHRRYALCGHHDDMLVHLLNRNDLLTLITYLRGLYASTPAKKYTEMLVNALISDRSGDAVVAHHKFAMILWMATVEVRATTNDQSNAYLTTLCRCIIRAAVTFPIQVTTLPKAKHRFISLQATLTFLYGAIAEPLLDQLAAMWDIEEFILGYKELANIDAHRHDIVQRLVRNYGVKLDNGSEHVKMLVILYHLACNLCGKYTINVADLTTITQWNVFFSFHFGTIQTFIATAELSSGNDLASHKSLLSRKSRKEQAARAAAETIATVAQSLTPTTFLKPSAHQQNLPFEKCPVHMRFIKQNEAMRNAAVDEILSAMPKVPHPMFIGDVGQLIGVWTKFNARYGGKLDLHLSSFLMSFPDKFRVLDNLVTRLQVGISEPIRIRFDNEIEEDSDDEGNGTGAHSKITGGKTLHRKAKRRQAKKDRNNARFNKNHQKFDPESKVPGYTKPKPKKVKGRGKKANVRRFKREQ